MKVKFLCDFQGVETGPHFYRKGQEVELEADVAMRLICDERCEAVTEENEPQPEPETPRKRGKNA